MKIGTDGALASNTSFHGYAVMDFETTGLSFEGGDRVVQVAIVNLTAHGQVESDWCSLIHPQRQVGAFEVHGISDSDVAYAPTFEQAWPTIRSALRGRCVVGQNIIFDLSFLKKELEILNVENNLQSITFFDNMQLAHLITQSGTRRQRRIATELGIDYLEMPGRGPHDALTDAHVAAEIFRYHLDNWPELVVGSLSTFEL